MKRVVLYGLMAAAASGSVHAADALGDDTGAWYLSPMAQYTLLDKDRISKDGMGYQVALGNDFAPHFAAEIALSTGSFSIKGSGASEKLNPLSLDFMYKFLAPTAVFRPYLLAGSGLMQDTIGGHAATNQGWLAEAGVGALTALGDQTGSTRWQLRTEVKYRRSFIQDTAYVPNNPNDIVFGVGLSFMFGAPVP
ncbi:MAG: outer membrane beta-barrel protein, partial [Steroidobacteraceae bacterium]